MNNSWLSLNIYTDSDKQEVISSYFDSFSLGNQFMKDHFTIYLPLECKNIAGKILDDIHNQYVENVLLKFQYVDRNYL